MKTNSENSDERVSDTEIQAALQEVATAKKKGRSLSAEERASREVASAEKKLQRDAKKAARDDAKSKKKDAPVHMAKVQRAGERLPGISEEARAVVDNAFDRFPTSEITGITAHLTHRVREQATLAAQTVTLEVGNLVRIADPTNRRYGELATITRVQRIRCYVRPLAHPDREEYLFTSLVEKVEQPSNIQGVDGGITSSQVTDEPFTDIASNG